MIILLPFRNLRTQNSLKITVNPFKDVIPNIRAKYNPNTTEKNIAIDVIRCNYRLKGPMVTKAQ